MKRKIISVLTLFVIGSACARIESSQTIQQPNIIYILADDMGIGDVGVYGQKKIDTPNIDKLAEEGMLFTQHYAGATVCAPSRSTLMTGQHTGHTPIRSNRGIEPEGQVPLPKEAITVADILKEQGYVTGAFGKWGLGFVGSEGDPNRQGFDEFYGYNCQKQAHRYYPDYLWRNDQKEILEGNNWKKTTTYSGDLIQKEALSFIEKNKDKPFFMYYPNVAPHAELIMPEGKLLKKYRSKFENEIPYQSNEKGANYGDEDFQILYYADQKEPHATFASMVELVDIQVGEIVSKLKELGLEENTIIVFASDNGPHKEGGADPDFFNSNGQYRGFKRDLYDGGIRTPMIVKWPNKVKANSISNHVSAFWDILPTFAEISEGKVPTKIDGISFLPTLLGNNTQEQHDYMYWEFHEQGGKQAVRKDNWKLVKLNVFNKSKTLFELYDLSKDASEQNDIAQNHPEIVKELSVILDQEHTESKLFPFVARKKTK